MGPRPEAFELGCDQNGGRPRPLDARRRSHRSSRGRVRSTCPRFERPAAPPVPVGPVGARRVRRSIRATASRRRIRRVTADDRQRRSAHPRRHGRRRHRCARLRGGCGGRRRPAADPARPPRRAPTSLDTARCEIRAARVDRRHRPRRGARLHRPPQPLRPGDPGRAAPRAQGPPGRHDRGHRRRRQLRTRPFTNQRRPRRLPDAQRRPRRPAGPSNTDWRTVADYLDALRSRRSASTSPTSSATRRCGSPPSAGTRSPADATAMDRQRGLLREAMEEGAFGLSSGPRLSARRLRDDRGAGDARWPRPRGSAASTTRTSATTLGDRFLDPFREAIEIGRRGGGPVHITHFYHRATFPGTPEQMLGLVDDARAEGLDVTFDLYPYEWASTRLLIMLPPWVQAGGVARAQGAPGRPGGPRPHPRGAGVARPAVRGRRRPGPTCGWAHFARPEHARWEGRTLGEVMADDRRATWSTPSATCCWPRTCASTRSRPGPHTAGMIAASGSTRSRWSARTRRSSRDKPSPRTYGSFPRILGEFVREERLTSLEEAVRKMTSAPAARLGLMDRGLLRDGLVADLVVFDPATIRSPATYDEPRRFPDRHPIRRRQRRAGRRRRRAHRRAAGSRASTRTPERVS